MFDVYCPGHRARVLLSSDDIELVVNGPAGIEVHWRCLCGGTGLWRPSRQPPSPEERS